ncbi:response regulator transcription factor [Clostridium gasigenes]|uniref:Stage 0 sporulation protein A homolog n=1 Tax=Clostridium gasigenes TaxID=94869 RepID=A0A1H0LEP0_9CLOT|nr:response regulator transcription factor [Clostridium gasigenes]MBB6624687.1 response regulator transcription factor [Clostridium gasigenes]MBB6714011.1 response regulator transcription factor [Clostridium gasigenes]MBU3087283.1 response regulator transcription factor [Clostridium gasigenes]SDO66647.1 DNA-binding response regulator, OmpR family, contains REC and winged-helix (wHTH) domain [Clostridium gasigenes]
MQKILIIEDTEKIRNELKELLIRYGYEVEAPSDLDNIVDHVNKEKPHLILLDINLPVYDGYYICREIRKTCDVPIIIVTSRDSEMDELMSMNLGADDFVTKPYNIQILLARIASIIKRTYKNNISDVLIYKELTLNLSRGTISVDNSEFEITKNEHKILNCLMKNKGNIVTRDELMEYLWTSELFIDDNTLTVNVNRLRKTLQNTGMKDAIETRRGIGYIMP